MIFAVINDVMNKATTMTNQIEYLWAVLCCSVKLHSSVLKLLYHRELVHVCISGWYSRQSAKYNEPSALRHVLATAAWGSREAVPP
jgi:hypothetical protein